MEDDRSSAASSATKDGQEGNSDDQCTFCNRISKIWTKVIEIGLERLRNSSRGDAILVSEIGCLSDILADSNCSGYHQALVHRLLVDINDGEPAQYNPKDTIIRIGWNLDTDRATLTQHITIGPNMTLNIDTEVLLVLKDPPSPVLPCIEQPRDEDYISIDLIRQWISDCEGSHRRCSDSTLPSIKLLWLIDTESRSLVSASHITRYVALSYVWGQTDMLKTTQATIPALQEVGALSATSLRIPRVVQHAISLCSQLSQRYLWVDSLCIVQDSTESLEHHIRHMASIFETATFTIVAADGTNADHGILGIRGISEPRTIPDPVFPLLGPRGTGLRKRPHQNIFDSPWGTRGWTLQEYIFSRRMLVFAHESVQWLCQESRGFEDTCQELAPERNKIWQNHSWTWLSRDLECVGDIALMYPRISQLEGIVGEYNKRSLTYENDVMRGLEAVFTAHRSAYPSGFFWGLPVDFFDTALLWSHAGDAKRRATGSTSGRLLFPSWTWAGWVGSLKPGNWRDATYIKEAAESGPVGKKGSTIPMLDWYFRSDTDVSKQPEIIKGHNGAYLYKQTFMGKKDELPPGWNYECEQLEFIQEDDMLEGNKPVDTDTESDSAEDNPTEGDKQDSSKSLSNHFAMATPYHYSHVSAPGIKFWHPVPVSISMPENATTPLDAPFLCARARSGRLWVIWWDSRPPGFEIFPWGGGTVRLFNDMVFVETLIMDITGSIVGDLYISDADDRDLVKGYKRRPEEVGFPCELVAISKGHDSIYPMEPEPESETYTFYNVLWIKWEDRIAYRRGVGRVTRETWQSMELVDVDLILG